MKRFGLRQLTLAIGIAAACFVAPRLWASNASQAAAIRKLEVKWAQAFRAKDVNAIMKFYVPGKSLVVFDVIPPREYVGWDAYKKDWDGFLGSFDGPVTLEMKDLAVETYGNLAYSHSIQHVAGKDKQGKPIDFTTRVTDVYRKIRGRWLIVHEHASVPVDLETGKADLQSKE